MTPTVTIPRELVEELLAATDDDPAWFGHEHITDRIRALLAQPQPDRVKVLEDAVREHQKSIDTKTVTAPGFVHVANDVLWAHLERGEG